MNTRRRLSFCVCFLPVGQALQDFRQRLVEELADDPEILLVPHCRGDETNGAAVRRRDCDPRGHFDLAVVNKVIVEFNEPDEEIEKYDAYLVYYDLQFIATSGDSDYANRVFEEDIVPVKEFNAISTRKSKFHEEFDPNMIK